MAGGGETFYFNPRCSSNLSACSRKNARLHEFPVQFFPLSSKGKNLLLLHFYALVPAEVKGIHIRVLLFQIFIIIFEFWLEPLLSRFVNSTAAILKRGEKNQRRNRVTEILSERGQQL